MLYRDTVVITELLQHVQPFLLADGQWQCSVGVQSTLCSVTAAAAGTGLKPPGLLSWRTACGSASWTQELSHSTTAEQAGVGQDAGAGSALAVGR